MAFTTLIFIFYFFPGSVAFWLIGKGLDKLFKKTRIADITLVISSVLFFGWMDYKEIAWLLIFMTTACVIGKLIEIGKLFNSKKLTIIFFVAGIIIFVILLLYYKSAQMVMAIAD